MDYWKSDSVPWKKIFRAEPLLIDVNVARLKHKISVYHEFSRCINPVLIECVFFIIEHYFFREPQKNFVHALAIGLDRHPCLQSIPEAENIKWVLPHTLVLTLFNKAIVDPHPLLYGHFFYGYFIRSFNEGSYLGNWVWISILRYLREYPRKCKPRTKIPPLVRVMQIWMHYELVLYIRTEKPAIINFIDPIEFLGNIQLVLIPYPIKSLRINGRLAVSQWIAQEECK